MASPIQSQASARPYDSSPEGPTGLTGGIARKEARRLPDDDAFVTDEARVQPQGSADQADVEDGPLDLLQHEATLQGLAPMSQQHIARLAGRMAGDAAFEKLVQAIADAFEGHSAPPDSERVVASLTEIFFAHPELLRTAMPPAARAGEPAPMDMRQLETNVVGMALAAMLAAHMAGNADKRMALRRTEMFNAILNGLNKYVSDVLMPAQRRMTATLARRKGREVGQTAIVVDGIASALNAEFAPYNEAAGRYEPEFAYDEAHGGSRQMTQQDIQFAIDQAGQWRQSLMNNQSRQTNTFQGIDSNQTSHMNILTSLLKNIKDSVDTVTRNLAN